MCFNLIFQWFVVSIKSFNKVLHIELIWLNSLTSSSSFFTDSLGFFTYTTISSTNKKLYIFPSNLYTCDWFFLPVRTAMISRKMLNKSSESMYSCLFHFTTKYDINCRVFRLPLLDWRSVLFLVSQGFF